MLTLTLAMLMAGCTTAPAPAAAPAGPAAPAEVAAQPAPDWPEGVKEAEVYTAVLRRYLTVPGDNSFPERFTTVYVLDHTDPPAPIPPTTRRRVTEAMAATAAITFIADRATVVEDPDGCPHVRDGGILITLGPANGDDNEVTVFIRGFVACLGGTSLTYVLRRTDGAGWQVTGTTGPMTIS